MRTEGYATLPNDAHGMPVGGVSNQDIPPALSGKQGRERTASSSLAETSAANAHPGFHGIDPSAYTTFQAQGRPVLSSGNQRLAEAQQSYRPMRTESHATPPNDVHGIPSDRVSNQDIPPALSGKQGRERTASSSLAETSAANAHPGFHGIDPSAYTTFQAQGRPVLSSETRGAAGSPSTSSIPMQGVVGSNPARSHGFVSQTISPRNTGSTGGHMAQTSAVPNGNRSAVAMVASGGIGGATTTQIHAQNAQVAGPSRISAGRVSSSGPAGGGTAQPHRPMGAPGGIRPPASSGTGGGVHPSAAPRSNSAQGLNAPGSKEKG